MRWPNFPDYRQDLREFYQPVNYAFAWTRNSDPTPQARAIIRLLQNADDKGLRIEDYDSHLWDARIASLLSPTQRPSPNDLAHFDVALTVSTMRYVSALRTGRINPQHLQLGLNIEKKRYRLAEFIRSRLIDAPDVNSVMEQVEPSYPAYRRTRIALLHYLALAREGDGDPLPPFKKPVKPGDTYTGVRQVAQLLQRLGDLQPSVSRPNVLRPPEADMYVGAVVEGVKHFQQRHGLPSTGTIDRTTFTQLNTPVSRRLFQLQLALERMRWLPTDLPGRLIMVNIPEFQLRAFDDYRTSLTMKVIVGKSFPERQTPIFQDEMEFLIFHPYWHVPLSITRKELIPAIKKSPDYMEKHHYELIDRGGGAVDASLTGDTLARLRSGDLEIRQKPGPGNSLGSIKFVFPNNYDVYLHGTPEQALFSRAIRAFSHGCIRIEDPAALAAWVLHDDPTWTNERIQAIMNEPDQVRVNLAKPIPVLVLYSTAVADENGEVRFVEDIYGQDAKLERALESGYPYPR